MDQIAYSDPFIPCEWIAAHGLKPVRITAPRMDKSTNDTITESGGTCSFMRGVINYACNNNDFEGVILTTACDQMRYGANLIQQNQTLPIFLMNIPSTWQSAGAHRLYESELMRLGLFLEKLGGTPPSNQKLAEVMDTLGRQRQDLLAKAGSLSPREFSESLASFPNQNQFQHTKSLKKQNKWSRCALAPDSYASISKVSNSKMVPLALIGGPLSADDFMLFDIIEEAGGTVVLDGTETGERTFPKEFDRRQLRETPIRELANSYFGSIPDVARRPNSMLYSWLKEEISVRDVQGVILVRWVWCDLWHSEISRLREWLAVPVLDLDLTGDDISGRNLTRIQAFMEALA